jgi:hypothetical protein
MACVCGHSEGEHVSEVMSVPLPPNGNPLYPIPRPAHYIMSIADSRDWATYDRLGCHCGCGDYLCDVES